MGSRRVFESLLRSGHRSGATFGGLLLAGSALLGCTASADDVRPPPDQFFFPTGVVVDPAETTLFVANANSELRYDSGAINALSLAEIDAIVSDRVGGKPLRDGCEVDEAQPETLVCDEAQLISTSVRIGNFATSLSIQDLGAGNARLIVPVRGDPSITWVDWNVNGDARSFACGDDPTGFSLCDDQHRLTLMRNDEELGGIQEEPFRAFVDSENSYALVTHLTSGTLTLIDLLNRPIVADRLDGLFLAGNNSFFPGGSGVAGRRTSRLDQNNDLVYVASRTEERVQMMTVERPTPAQVPGEPEVYVPPFLVPGNYFFLRAAGGNNGQSKDSRGLAFAADGDRMLVINRRPPTLQIYDTSLDATGVPRNTPVAVYDICREASGLVVGDAGGGELALVSCFRDGTLYIIDAAGRRPTDAVITVGRGPYDIAVSSTHKKAYVTNFLEDTVGVIDLAPGSKTQYREVLRIGKTRL